MLGRQPWSFAGDSGRASVSQLFLDPCIHYNLDVERLQPIHSQQLLTYLRPTDLRLGLLINFRENLLKDGFKRALNGLEDR